MPPRGNKNNENDATSSSDEDDTLGPGKHVKVIAQYPELNPTLGQKRKFNSLIQPGNLTQDMDALLLGTQPVVNKYQDNLSPTSSSTPPLGPQHIPPSSGELVFRFPAHPNKEEIPVTALTSVPPASSLSSSKGTEI